MKPNDLTLTAPDTAVIDQLEEPAIQRGRETLCTSLEQAVHRHIDDAEKRRRTASVPAAKSGKTAARASGS